MASTQLPSLTIGELLKRYRKDAQLTQKELAKRMEFYSYSIVSRVETGEQWPQPEYINQFIKVLLLDEAQRTELLTMYYRQSGGTTGSPAPAFSRHEGWGEAPDVSVFFGRQDELAELSRWLTADRCRLVAVLGMGGIGKTSLVTKLAEQIKAEFDYVLWRSLRNAPPLADLLTDCLKFLSDQQRTDLPGEVNAQINLLLDYLRQKRCLLILDNLETILQAETRAGEYRQGYAAYGQLIQQVGQGRHQSCLVLTSREKPKELMPLTGTDRPVRTLALPGLDQPDSRALLQDRELHGDESAWAVLTQRYAGNPLALRQVSATIQDLYGGEISAFLKEITTMFGEIRYLLEQQFNRLSKLEQDVMYWLAINREPVSIPELREDLVQPVSAGELAEVLEALLRRSLIEKSTGHFTLQNVIMEYVTDRLIERASEEIMLESINLLQSHALMKATAKDYVRESQVRLLLKPVFDRLLTSWGQTSLKDSLMRIVVAQRKFQPYPKGYMGGNILNLLLHLKRNLTNADFSCLAVWQAYLQEADLQNVSFAYADLTKSVFTETFGAIPSITFSPDGKLLAFGTGNGVIHSLLVDGTPFITYEGHNAWVTSIAFSPDGLIIGSGSDDQTIKLWNVNNGKCLKTFHGHTQWVRSIAFSPDGKALVSVSEDQTIKLWDVATGVCLKTFYGHNQSVRSVVFSPNGRLLASASEDQTVKLWDITMEKCLRTLSGHTHSVRSVAFSPDGQLLASSSEDQTVRLWNVNSGDCLEIFQGHNHRVRAVAFSPNGQILATGSEDQTIKLWDVTTKHCVKTLQAYDHRVRAIAFSPNGQILASSSSEDQGVKLWDIKTGQCLKTLFGYTNWIRSLAFSPNGQILVSGSDDHAIKLWDINRGECFKTLHGHNSWLTSVTFSPDGEVLASGSDDRTVKLWNINTGHCVETFRGHGFRVWSVTFSPNAQVLVSSSEDQTVKLWNIALGQCLNTLSGHHRRVRSVAISPNGRILATGSDDQTVKLWDTNTGQHLKTFQAHDHWVTCVEFSPDGQLLASSSEDRTVKIWNVKTSECLKTFHGHHHWVTCVAFSPDGLILASSSEDKTVKLWNVNTGACSTTLLGHTNGVLSVIFNPNGSTIASGGRDEIIKIWDIHTSECLKTLRPDRPYERMNITGVIGLTETQKASLKALGAIDLHDATTIEG